MSIFGNYGRLGNQLFQYASLIGIAKKYNNEIKLPDWPYAKFFAGQFPAGEVEGIAVNEPTFKYIPDWDSLDWDKDLDFKGYFQSEKYFKDYKHDVRKALTFKADFKRETRKQFDVNLFDKETIAISIRRGDYVNNSNYELLPITYYILALFENFPEWRESNIIIFSDDIPYCKVHFDCLENVYYSENNSDIEDLCLMSHCDHFITSNSTFSWWGAYLGEKFHSKIIRPNYLFAGKLLASSDWSDFYPERWITFDHKKGNGENKKIDLSDCCFTIPVAYDHEDRRENLDLCIAVLRRNFETKICVLEQHNESTLPAFRHVDALYLSGHYDNKFHRTKMLNEMALSTNTEIVFNWDADVFIAPLQIYECAHKIRSGADMCFPYKSMFARIPRQPWFTKIRDHEDIGLVGDTKFNGMNNNDAVSVGGAVAFRRESFIEGGMENEKFISYGPEDVERHIRFRKLGYKIDRTWGVLYHMNHFVGPDSSNKNIYFSSNRGECERIELMESEELRNYTKSWPWIPINNVSITV